MSLNEKKNNMTAVIKTAVKTRFGLMMVVNSFFVFGLAKITQQECNIIIILGSFVLIISLISYIALLIQEFLISKNREGDKDAR